MPTALDPSILRQRFPSLSLEVDGQPAIFLDAPGGSQTPQSVIEAIGNYLQHSNSNRGGAFRISKQTDQIVREARRAMADFFNARRPEEIVFGQNMTSLTFAMSRSLSREWQVGDEIVVTRLDHDANISPWLLAAADRDVTIRWLDLRPEDCTLDLERLPALLNERTRLVAITRASNAVGTIVDIARVSAMAHEVGAHVFVDAVHYAPHGPLDVQELDCDFLVASSYKFFGPHTGVMYGRYKLLNELPAYKVRPAPDLPPGKWETGTQSFESLAGVRAAVDYLASLGQQAGSAQQVDSTGSSLRRTQLVRAMVAIKQHEQNLSQHFLMQAATVPGLRVYGITDVERLSERVPTFAVSLNGFAPREIAQRLAKLGIFVWDGHYYAIAVMERLGLLERGGLVRLGFIHYNTHDEVERTVLALQKLVAD